MAFNFCQLFILFGLLQGIICIVILLGFKPIRSKSNLYLSLLILSFIGNLFQYWLQDTEIISNNSMQLIFLPWQMLIAPFFYLYVHSLKIFDLILFKKWILFMPLILVLIFHAIIKILIVKDGIDSWSRPEWVSTFYLLEELLSLAYCLIVTVIVYRLIRKEKQRINYHGFGINRKIVNWIKILLQMGLGLALIWVVSLYIVSNTQNFRSYYFLWSVMAVVLNVLGIVGIYYTYSGGGFSKFDLTGEHALSLSSKSDTDRMTVSAPQKYLKQDLLDSMFVLSSELAGLSNARGLQILVTKWFKEEFKIEDVMFHKEKNTSKNGPNFLQIPYTTDTLHQKYVAIKLNNDGNLNESHLYYFNMVIKVYSYHEERIYKSLKNNKLDSSNKTYQLLLKSFDEEELYINPNLDLNFLAQELDVSPGYLSKIINDITGKSFNDFVNEYRIDKAKLLMQNPDFAHYNIVGYGLEAGFNSKSTFYKAFQNKEGLSPGRYLDNVKHQ